MNRKPFTLLAWMWIGAATRESGTEDHFKNLQGNYHL